MIDGDGVPGLSDAAACPGEARASSRRTGADDRRDPAGGACDRGVCYATGACVWWAWMTRMSLLRSMGFVA